MYLYCLIKRTGRKLGEFNDGKMSIQRFCRTDFSSMSFIHESKFRFIK